MCRKGCSSICFQYLYCIEYMLNISFFSDSFMSANSYLDNLLVIEKEVVNNENAKVVKKNIMTKEKS